MKKKQILVIQVLSALFIVAPAFGQTLKRDFSFSLYSYLSTNHIFSSRTTNKFSFNLLQCHSNGTERLEVGGLVNMDKGYVKYLQLAGLANIDGDSLEGMQAAGLFNIVKKDVNGFQSAGLFNHTNSMNGLQLAGVYNYNQSHFKGVQAGGLFNHTNSMNGVQLAGVYNYNQSHFKGVQAGGLFNIVESLKGCQIAGLYNQVGDVNGIQISGLVNKAKIVSGCQLGVVNLSDSCKGIPIGLFSYVKSGYHSMEISANELGFVNIGWRTGVNKFHNVFFAGVNGFAPKFLWTLGYGIGSTHAVSKKWQLTCEASSQQIFTDVIYRFRMVSLHKVSIAAEYKYSNHFSIALGPSFNVLNYDNRSIQYASSINAIVPYSIHNISNIEDKMRTKTWVGAHISFKFF